MAGGGGAAEGGRHERRIRRRLRGAGHGRGGGLAGSRRDELAGHLRALKGYALTLTHDGPAADDLVQETLVKALKALPRLPPEANLRAWLIVILRNSFLSARRRARREAPDSEGVLSAGLAVKPRQDGAVALDELLAALRRIPHEQREALVLVGACGFSCTETAAMTGVAPGTVKSRVSRARRRLGQLLHLRTGERLAAEDRTALSVLATRGVRAFAG